MEIKKNEVSNKDLVFASYPQCHQRNYLDIKIGYACNFKCEYCYQVFDGKRQIGTFKKEYIAPLLSYLDRTKSLFFVMLAGGEPFIYPYLNEISDALIRKGHYLGIITNFSASKITIENFLLKTNGFLKFLSISVHLSQWENIEDFFCKFKNIIEFIKKNKMDIRIRTTCVLTAENVDMVKSLYRKMKEYGFLLYIQRVYYNGKYQSYSSEIENYFKDKGLDVRSENIDNVKFYGNLCSAGSRFLYIESNGDVFRCYTQQENEKLYKLGSLDKLEKIPVLNKAYPCLAHENCVCFKHFKQQHFITDQKASRKELNEALNFNQTIAKRISNYFKH